MPRDPWLAIDAVTPPALRARELRREWEQFVSGGRVSGVRAPVADSWRRSLDAGVDPSGSRLAPVTADRAEAFARWELHPLAEAAPLIRHCLASIAAASDHLVVVSDAAGVLLQVEGNARVRSQAADAMNFTEGALWSEHGAGTNAIGTALAADHAVQIFATEHFIEVVQAWTCSAAPVHDPETGELLGIIDLTGLEKHVHPHSLAVAMTTARAVEGHLRLRLQERDDRLRARYHERITGGPDRRALVSPAGRPVVDHPSGWLHGVRLELPPGGGELILPSGAHALAEPVGREEAFIVRDLETRRMPDLSLGDELRMLTNGHRHGNGNGHGSRTPRRRLSHPRAAATLDAGEPSPSRSAHATLLGRQNECRALDRLIAAVRTGTSGAVVVRGEPGAGKSALLRYAMEAASPACQVVWATGVESETELAFAGLHQLCAPMLDRLDRLPGPQREALEAAFGLSASAAPDPFFVALAVLGLLSDAATARPLVCLVDDVQWLDRASANALAIVARRLGVESVALVFAARDPGGVLAGLPELALSGLRDHDARALLESVLVGPVDARVVERIVAETGGNPLALLEWPSGLAPAELAGGFVVPDGLALPAPVEAEFRRRFEQLPPDAWRLLLIAAAESVGDPGHLWRAVARLGIPPDAAIEAARAGLVEIGARVRFRHPLVRSAVYRAATPAELRDAHRALALTIDAGMDPDRRAWHRANSIAGPDEEVAVELERSAGRAQRRGGVAAAAAFLERAAALSSDPAALPDRALRAAEAKLQAGAPAAALDLLVMADAAPLRKLQRARLDRLRGQVAFASDGRGVEAPPVLLGAARRLEALDARLARETYLDALQAAMTAGALSDQLAEVARAARVAPPPPGPPTATDHLLDSISMLFSDGHAAAAPGMARALAETPDETWTRWPWFLALLAWELWDIDSYGRIAARQVASAREAGAVQSLLPALSMLAIASVHNGDLEEAEVLVEEAEALAAATGTTRWPWARMVLAAWRGREPEAVRAIAAAVGDATERGEGLLLPFGDLVTAVLRNGLGDYAAALTAARRASECIDLGFVSRALPELVEAAARNGEPDTAADALARLRELTRPPAADWALGVEAYCTALVEPERAEAHFRRALEHLEHTGRGVYRARAHLLYGEWLRRERRRIEAREQLRTAHELFTAMGAEAFSERAGRELLATGQTVRKRGVESADQLTAQEAQIARLARDGLSNPEIGARLFISPRTVEYHLRKVFAKLDISSRNQLDHVLPGEPQEAQAV
jgi:DNA-binding CsgD family transcriptional regulator